MKLSEEVELAKSSATIKKTKQGRKMMSKRFRLLAVFLVMVLALVACSNDEEKESSATPSNETSQESSVDGGESSTENVVSSQEEPTATEGDLSLDEVVKKAEAYYADAKSLQYQIDAISMGQSMNMLMKIDENSNMTAETVIQGTTMTQYLMNDNGTYTQYVSSDGQNYIKSQVETGMLEVEQAKNQPTSNMPMSNLDIFTMTTDASGNYVISGAPSLSDLAGDAEFTENLQSQSGSTGLDFSEYTATIPIKAVVDKNDFHYIEMSIDMSNFMAEMFEKVMGELETSGNSMPELGNLQMIMTMKDMQKDTVEPIVLPAEAQNAEEVQLPDTSNPMPAPTNP